MTESERDHDAQPSTEWPSSMSSEGRPKRKEGERLTPPPEEPVPVDDDLDERPIPS